MTGIGDLFDGRYKLDRPIGDGGMSEVWLGHDLRLNRDIAVKLMLPELAAIPMFRARFGREARAVANLSHPGIVSVFDSGEHHDAVAGVDLPYIVMEFIEGRTLRQLLAADQPVLPERALEIAHDVLDALSYSHCAGVIHRDIKPSNVMVTRAGTVKVMDFGIARTMSDVSATLTQPGWVMGTGPYLSPEQARGDLADARSDIYSVGCLLYELLTGSSPTAAASVTSQQFKGYPPVPSLLSPAVPADLDDVVMRALARSPADRYQAADDMKLAVDRVLAGQPTESLGDESTEPERSTRPHPVPGVGLDERRHRNRNRVAAITLIVVAAILLSLLGVPLLANRQPTADAASAVSVPALIGTSRAEAELRLRSAELIPRFKQVRGPADDTLRTVIRQQPGSGTEVSAQTTVVVEINVGPATAKVPLELIGRRLSLVKEQLDKAGFEKIRTRSIGVVPGETADQEVLFVSPGEGQAVPLTETITITYAVTAPASDPSRTSSDRDGGDETAGSRAGGEADPTKGRPEDTPGKDSADSAETTSNSARSTQDPGGSTASGAAPTQTSGEPTTEDSGEPTESDEATSPAEPAPTTESSKEKGGNSGENDEGKESKPAKP